MIGAIGVVLGLYVVLWGKAKDHTGKEEETDAKLLQNNDQNVKILINDESSKKTTCQIDLEEPLLGDKTTEDCASNGHQC